ncbi:MerR family transcriptional regulator [Acidobacteriota bacterium]
MVSQKKTVPKRVELNALKKIGFSPRLAERIVGVNYNTILYWVRTGLVKASIRYESKQWQPVLFSFDDLLELKFIKSLRDKGAPTRRIRRALSYLRKNIPEHRRELYIDVTDDDIQIYLSAQDVMSVAKTQGQLLLINVGQLRKDVASRTFKQAKRKAMNLKLATG